jgi:hypothetical protein
MRTLLLTLIAMNETVGAILFRRALQKAGEVGGEGVGIEMMESQVAGRTSQTV